MEFMNIPNLLHELYLPHLLIYTPWCTIHCNNWTPSQSRQPFACSVQPPPCVQQEPLSSLARTPSNNPIPSPYTSKGRAAQQNPKCVLSAMPTLNGCLRNSFRYLDFQIDYKLSVIEVQRPMIMYSGALWGWFEAVPARPRFCWKWRNAIVSVAAASRSPTMLSNSWSRLLGFSDGKFVGCGIDVLPGTGGIS